MEPIHALVDGAYISLWICWGTKFNLKLSHSRFWSMKWSASPTQLIYMQILHPLACLAGNGISCLMLQPFLCVRFTSYLPSTSRLLRNCSGKTKWSLTLESPFQTPNGNPSHWRSPIRNNVCCQTVNIWLASPSAVVKSLNYATTSDS